MKRTHGDCLQMGIGAIPDATLRCLGNLRAKSLTERAEALINISAPQFREELAKQAWNDWGLKVRTS